MPENVLYDTDGRAAIVTLNRPKYKNAQSYDLLDELDAALDRAMADREIKIALVRGSGGNFSSGHDLGTPEQTEWRERRQLPPSGLEYYDNFRHYNFDITHKWRNLPKPTLAVVEGYCIYGGWMIAGAMDLIFAGQDALFLAGQVEYFALCYDVGVRKAKELMFESRFITAEEGRDLGFVNRVYAKDELWQESLNYAHRVAEGSSMALRMAKLAANKAQDQMGYSNSVENAFADYLVMAQNQGTGRVRTGERRLGGVDMAMRGLRGERPGLKPGQD